QTMRGERGGYENGRGLVGKSAAVEYVRFALCPSDRGYGSSARNGGLGNAAVAAAAVKPGPTFVTPIGAKGARNGWPGLLPPASSKSSVAAAPTRFRRKMPCVEALSVISRIRVEPVELALIVASVLAARPTFEGKLGVIELSWSRAISVPFGVTAWATPANVGL